MLPIFHNRLQGIARQERNRRLILERRILRDHSNPFELTEERFVELYRLSKDAALYLLEILNPFLSEGMYQNSIPNFIKMFSTLRFYATGSYQRDLGLSYNVSLSQTSVHRCIHQVTRAIEDIVAPQEIAFPRTHPQQNRNKETFLRMFGFPGVVGCIDGTHIAILEPVQEPQNFYNRKGFYSINVMIICDADLKILCINANYPGSNHDSYIWRQSTVRDFLVQEFLGNRLQGSWLLGDSGYMLEPFLMIPFLNPPENTPQSRYNWHHTRARNTIERCIGVWKCRFRALLRERSARYSPGFFRRVIIACAALHNLCIRFNVQLLDEPFMENDPFVPNIINPNHNLHRQGNNVRDNIVNWYFVQ